jgi:hypothetical protein
VASSRSIPRIQPFLDRERPISVVFCSRVENPTGFETNNFMGLNLSNEQVA